MPELEQVEEVKSAFVQNRQYSNAERNKRDEEELEEMKAEQRNPTVSEEEEDEPEGAEEKTFKKRYGDLRRHTQKEAGDLKEKIHLLEGQLTSATKKEIKLPKSDEEIEAWAMEYPDVAAIVETIALKKSKEQQLGIEKQLEELNSISEQTKLDKAEVELLTLHPDFSDIRDKDEFHDWAEAQPKWVQDALYENANDARSAARAIDLYKVDMGITATKSKPSSKDAARSVNTKGSRTSPQQSQNGTISESDVQAMTTKEYDDNKDAVMDAVRSGKFIYDISGANR